LCQNRSRKKPPYTDRIEVNVVAVKSKVEISLANGTRVAGAVVDLDVAL